MQNFIHASHKGLNEIFYLAHLVLLKLISKHSNKQMICWIPCTDRLDDNIDRQAIDRQISNKYKLFIFHYTGCFQ